MDGPNEAFRVFIAEQINKFGGSDDPEGDLWSRLPAPLSTRCQRT
jgi:hypothetical protein